MIPFNLELALYALHEDEKISRVILAFQVVSHDHVMLYLYNSNNYQKTLKSYF